MRHTYLLVLLGCALRPSPVGAQSPAPSGTAPFVPAPSVAAQNEARLKGAIWTTTAGRAWQDLKLLPQSKQPEPWDTPDDFEKWRKQHAQNDRAGLIGLHDKVLKFTGQKSVSPAGLKAAILHEIGSLRYEGRHVDQQKLAEALNKVAPAAEVAKSVLPTPDSVANDGGSAPGPSNANADANAKASAATTQHPPAESIAPEAPANAPAFSWSLVISGFIGFLLGLVGTAALRHFLREQRESEERREARHEESERIKRYKAENKRLVQEMNDLRKQNAQFQTRRGAPPHPTPRPHAMPPAAPEAAESAPAPDPIPAAAPPTARPKFYASAAPGGLLEHDKLAAQSMGRMALLVEPNGQNPQSARFTLNPDVDKSWLIAADLEKLRDYFTFTLPADRWPSSVEAAAPGTLTREGNGWKVGKKAALTVR